MSLPTALDSQKKVPRSYQRSLQTLLDFPYYETIHIEETPKFFETETDQLSYIHFIMSDLRLNFKNQTGCKICLVCNHFYIPRLKGHPHDPRMSVTWGKLFGKDKANIESQRRHLLLSLSQRKEQFLKTGWIFCAEDDTVTAFRPFLFDQKRCISRATILQPEAALDWQLEPVSPANLAVTAESETQTLKIEKKTVSQGYDYFVGASNIMHELRDQLRESQKRGDHHKAQAKKLKDLVINSVSEVRKLIY